MAVPVALPAVLLGTSCFLALCFALLMSRRFRTERLREAKLASRLYALREIAACFDHDGQVDAGRLAAAVETAPMEAVVQYLRIHRSDERTKVMAAVQAAGKFHPALKALRSDLETHQLAALYQLQFARGTPFLEAVRHAAMSSRFSQVRCEAVSTLLDMETHPAAVAVARWINDSGPALTGRHEILLKKVALHYFHEIELLAFAIENPCFEGFLRSAHAEAKQTAALLQLAPFAPSKTQRRSARSRFLVEA